MLRRPNRERGQGLAEYAMLLVVIAVPVLIILVVFGDGVTTTYRCVIQAVEWSEQSTISGMTLIDSTTERELTPFCGQPIRLGPLGTNPNVRVETAGEVGSVRFDLTGASSRSSTENEYPWSLWGNTLTPIDYFAGSFNTGDHTLTVTAYSGTGGGGRVLGQVTVEFVVE